MMKLPRITLGCVWLLLPAILTLAYVGTLVQFPLDFWHHLVTGRQIAQLHSTTAPDAFTYTIQGQAIVNQSWLAQWLTYELFRQGGFALVQFACAVCYALAIALVAVTAWRRCGNPRVAAVLTFAAAAMAASNFGVRPQAMSLVLFSAELAVLWHWGNRWQSAVAVALVEVLWANSHGAFPLGIAVCGVFLLGTAATVWRNEGWVVLRGDRAVRVYLLCTAVAMAAAFCNPHFRETARYFFVVASKSSQRQLGEWLPTTWGSYTGDAFLLSLFPAAAIMAADFAEASATEILLLVVFGVLAGTAQRMVVWWGLLLPTVLAPHLAAIVRRWAKRPAGAEMRSAANVAVLGILLCWAAMCTPWTRSLNPLLPAAKRAAAPADEPAAAVAALRRTGFAGRMFQPLEWGAYFSWQLYPQATIFIDGRVDSYPDAVWSDYVQIGNAQPGWESLLDRYGVECVVWDPVLSGKLPAALRASQRWKEIQSDAVSVVFLRRNSASKVKSDKGGQ